MCGIAGFVTGPGAAGDAWERLALDMAAAISHRGPDDQGAWVDQQAGVALSHRRLSIIDLSPEGHQPMVSGDARWVLAFNGEIYNFSALRTELAAAGHTGWRGGSDTEVLLAAIATWGFDAALTRCNGMFAIACWDRQHGELWLARDRLGEKPLYYGGPEGLFLFGSELKALKAHPGFRPEVDRNALALYFRHNYIPAPWCIWQGVRKLRPGHRLRVRVRAGRVVEQEEHCWWRARDVVAAGMAEPLLLNDREATDALEQQLLRSVGSRMHADVPLGAFLSGGIDSSVVVAMMQAQASRPARTFAIGFEEQGYNEAPFANEVAAALGTDHTEFYVSAADAMAVVPQLPRTFDEPFSDSSQIPTLLVSRLARAQVTVALSGDGGDELFGGYNRYFWSQKIWRSMGWLPRPLRAGVGRGVHALSPEAWQRGYSSIRGILPKRLQMARFGDRMHKLADVFGSPSPEAMYRLLVSHWNHPEQLVHGAVEPLTNLTDPDWRLDTDNFMLQMMYLDSVSYLPDDILAKVDRASMAVGLEARVPLLDHELYAFAHRLPLQQRVRGGTGKWLLREVLYRHVPKHLIDRPKMGFGLPIGPWLRGPLRAWAESLLAPERLQQDGFLAAEPVQRLWQEHQRGERNWQYLLWDVLMFQAWLEEQR